MVYSLEKAQKLLDERNGNFLLLEYQGARCKNLTRCKICGHEWKVITDGLSRNKSPSKGCPNCFLLQGKVQKLNNNNLDFISYDSSTKRNQVRCKKCGFVFKGTTGNLTSEKFNCQNCSKIDTKKYKLKKLLDKNLQSYYILGFIFADGYIEEKGRLRVVLQEKDSALLKKISLFLLNEDVTKHRFYNNYKSIEFSVMDKDTMQKLKLKFNLTNNKTYNPPNITFQGDALTAFIIGFIDGDGHLGFRQDNNKPFINIKNHVSWEENLQQMANYLYKKLNLEPPKVRLVENNKYSEIRIGNQEVLNYLKIFVENKLDFVLNRKWRY